jgi:hypothetical protein
MQYLRPSRAIRLMARVQAAKAFPAAAGRYRCAPSQAKSIGGRRAGSDHDVKSKSTRLITKTTTSAISEGTPDSKVLRQQLVDHDEGRLQLVGRAYTVKRSVLVTVVTGAPRGGYRETPR